MRNERSPAVLGIEQILEIERAVGRLDDIGRAIVQPDLVHESDSAMSPSLLVRTM